METFITEVSRMARVLQRSTETELDYSLKDAKRLICGMDMPPLVTLDETDRGPMRDISMNIRWGTHSIKLSIIASERFFTIRNAPLYINGILTDWTWNSKREKFHVDADDEVSDALWDFYTAITNVL